MSGGSGRTGPVAASTAVASALGSRRAPPRHRSRPRRPRARIHLRIGGRVRVGLRRRCCPHRSRSLRPECTKWNPPGQGGDRSVPGSIATYALTSVKDRPGAPASAGTAVASGSEERALEDARTLRRHAHIDRRRVRREMGEAHHRLARRDHDSADESSPPSPPRVERAPASGLAWLASSDEQESAADGERQQANGSEESAKKQRASLRSSGR